MAESADFAVWHDFDAGQTNRNRRLASDVAERREPVLDISSGAQPGFLVVSGGRSMLVELADQVDIPS